MQQFQKKIKTAKRLQHSLPHRHAGFNKTKKMRQRGRAPGAAPSDDTSATGNGSSTDGGTSDGSRDSLRRDDDVLVVSCTVVYDHRFVRLRIAVHDTIESLVELTEIKLHKKYPNESLSHAIVGIRSQRLEKGANVFPVSRRVVVGTKLLKWMCVLCVGCCLDLYLNAYVGDVIMEDDILEVRPYTIAQSVLKLNRSTRFR